MATINLSEFEIINLRDEGGALQRRDDGSIRQVANISSWDNIPVCSPFEQNAENAIQLRLATGEGAAIGFPDESTYTQVDAVHWPSLFELRQMIPLWVRDEEYESICRLDSHPGNSTNKYPVLGFKEEPTASDEDEALLAALGIDTEEESNVEGVFESCEAGIDDMGSKIELNLELTEDEARYITEKFGTDGTMYGCHETVSNGKYNVWITHNYTTLDRVIARIENDINTNSLPENISRARANEIIGAIRDVRQQNPFIMQIEANEMQLQFAQEQNEYAATQADFSETMETLSWLQLAATLLFVGVVGFQPLKEVWRSIRGRVRVTDYGKWIREKLAADPNFNVLGRDAEAAAAWEMTDTIDFRSIIFDLPTGEGKDEIIKKMIIMKESGDPVVPEAFRDASVFRVSIAQFKEKTKYRGTVADKVMEIVRRARKGKVILVISEIDLLLLGGNTEQSGDTESPHRLFLNELDDPVIKENLIILGSTSRGAELLALGEDVQRRFNWPTIRIFSLQEVRDVIDQGYTKIEYARKYGVEIPSEIVDAAARLAETYYRTAQTKFDRKTGRLVRMPRFDAIKKILEDACKNARKRYRQSATSASDGANGDNARTVTLEDVIEAVEKRCGKCFDRAEIDRILSVDDINSLELPPLPQPRSPFDDLTPPPPAVSGATDPRSFRYPVSPPKPAKPGTNSGYVYYPNMCTPWNPDGLPLPAPISDPYLGAWGFEPAYAYAASGAIGAERYVHDPYLGTSYRLAQGAEPSPQPSSSGSRGAEATIIRISEMNPSAATPASFLAMFGFNGAVTALTQLFGINEPWALNAINDMNQFLGFGAGHATATSVATGRRFAEVLFDRQVAAEFVKASGAFFFIGEYITNPIFENSESLQQLQQKLGPAGHLLHMGATMGLYAVGRSIGTRLWLAAGETFGLNGANAVKTIGKGFVAAGLLTFAATALPHLEEARNHFSAWIRGIDMSDGDKNRALLVQYGHRHDVRVSQDFVMGLRDRDINYCISAVQHSYQHPGITHPLAPNLLEPLWWCDTADIRETISELNDEARNSANDLRGALGQMLFSSIMPALVQDQASAYDGTSDPAVNNDDLDVNMIHGLLSQRIHEILSAPAYAVEPDEPPLPQPPTAPSSDMAYPELCDAGCMGPEPVREMDEIEKRAALERLSQTDPQTYEELMAPYYEQYNQAYEQYVTEYQAKEYVLDLLTYGVDSPQMIGSIKPSEDELASAYDAILKDLMTDLSEFELPIPSDLGPDRTQVVMSSENPDAIATFLMNYVFDSTGENVNYIYDTTDNYRYLRRMGFLMANADENGIVDANIEIFDSEINDLVVSVPDQPGRYAINQESDYFEQTVQMAQMAQQMFESVS